MWPNLPVEIRGIICAYLANNDLAILALVDMETSSIVARELSRRLSLDNLIIALNGRQRISGFIAHYLPMIQPFIDEMDNFNPNAAVTVVVPNPTWYFKTWNEFKENNTVDLMYFINKMKTYDALVSGSFTPSNPWKILMDDDTSDQILTWPSYSEQGQLQKMSICLLKLSFAIMDLLSTECGYFFEVKTHDFQNLFYFEEMLNAWSELCPENITVAETIRDMIFHHHSKFGRFPEFIIEMAENWTNAGDEYGLECDIDTILWLLCLKDENGFTVMDKITNDMHRRSSIKLRRQNMFDNLSFMYDIIFGEGRAEEFLVKLNDQNAFDYDIMKAALPDVFKCGISYGWPVRMPSPTLQRMFPSIDFHMIIQNQ